MAKHTITSRAACTCDSIEAMGIHIPQIRLAKQVLRRVLSTSGSSDIPKGHFAVYVGETEKKRFVIPVAYLNHHLFHKLLTRAEEEFGFEHPMGGLTLPCREEIFEELICKLHRT